MLTAKNIIHRIGHKTLLDNVSVSFEPGKLNLIIGPNGAGKSTLVKVICNQIHPSVSGEVRYGNLEIGSAYIRELACIRSVLSQNIELAFPLKVHEVVMMGRYPHFTGKPTQKDFLACEESLNFFDVADLAGRNYMTLSGGEKQRVHFARVIAQIWYPYNDHCRYLILDEPLTFLDVHYQFNFMHKLLALLKNNDMVVVGVVHDLNLAARFADKIVLLHEGRVLAEGDKLTVLSEHNIRTAYRIEPVIHQDHNGMHLFFK